MKDALKGKTALVSGASSGIGAQVARDLAARGARVLLVARRRDRLVTLKKEIENSGGQVQFFVCDLEDAAARADLIREILKQANPIDILVNNAGFGWYGYYADMPLEIRNSLLKINIEAILDLTSALLPGMRERAAGHIINIGSIAGIFPNQGVVLYSATKSFLHGFNTALHRELSGSGVHSSVMNLGPVKTEFFDQARKIEGGRSVPAEKLAVSIGKVNQALWRLLDKPKRAVYVPGWLYLVNYADLLFGGIVDLVGPVLLRRRKS